MRCIFGHDWRDVATIDGRLYQECARCGRRRVYHKGIGPRAVAWTAQDVAPRDVAVIRIVLTAEGKPAGLGLVERGPLRPEEAAAFATAMQQWEQDPTKFLLVEADDRVRFEFVTIEQLTAQG